MKVDRLFTKVFREVFLACFEAVPQNTLGK
jgi:hypothetical protein